MNDNTKQVTITVNVDTWKVLQSIAGFHDGHCGEQAKNPSPSLVDWIVPNGPESWQHFTTADMLRNTLDQGASIAGWDVRAGSYLYKLRQMAAEAETGLVLLAREIVGSVEAIKAVPEAKEKPNYGAVDPWLYKDDAEKTPKERAQEAATEACQTIGALEMDLFFSSCYGEMTHNFSWYDQLERIREALDEAGAALHDAQEATEAAERETDAED